MTKTFRLASFARHWRTVGNRTALEPVGLVFLIERATLLAIVLMGAKSRLLTDPSDTCRRRTTGADYDCDLSSTSSQSSGVLNRQRAKIPEYPMRSRYESSRIGLATILLSFVAIKTTATSDGSRN